VADVPSGLSLTPPQETKKNAAETLKPMQYMRDRAQKLTDKYPRKCSLFFYFG
jgi:hypothetical protein